MTKTLLVILGPTAVGKTSLSVNLAQHFDTEIISADSRQFYKEMAIGTAKPTVNEMDGIKHHLVNFLSIHEDYTAGQFERDSLEILDNIFENNQLAIMVGGSGLFIDAVCNGLDPIPRDLEIRKELNNRFENNGLDPLVKELLSLDPDLVDIVDLKNPMRVIRALEVCLTTGKTFSSQRLRKPKERPFRIIKIGLNTERQLLYDRINKRCDIMLEDGWEKEAKALLQFRQLNSLNTVGYKELFDYFEGKLDRETCVKLIKQHTRNFAKRQLTWFNKDQSTHWVDPIKENAFQEVLITVEAETK